MNKKIIGIDINEILRSICPQFEKYYIEEFGEEGLPPDDDFHQIDFFKHYKFEDTVEENNILNEEFSMLNEDDSLKNNISPLDYQLDKDGKSKIDALAFNTETTKLTAKQVFNRFLYEDYLFEIFGAAPKSYQNVDLDAEKFYNKYKDQFEIMIVSKENHFSISPTLFFISKLNPRFKSYFFGTAEEILDKVDILITTDPEMLDGGSVKVKKVRVKRPYNKSNNGYLDAINLIDLVDVFIEDEDTKEMIQIENQCGEFQKLIGYKNKETKVKEA